MKPSLGKTLSSKSFWLNNIVYIVCVLAFIVFAIINPVLVSKDNIMNILASASTFIVLGTGVAFALLIQQTDLSVGSIMYAAAAIMFYFFKQDKNLPIPVVMLIGIAVGIAVGLINGVIIATLKVYAFLPTLATQVAFRGLGLIIAGASISNMPMKWAKIVSLRWFGMPAYIIISFLLAIAAQLFLVYTKLGRHIYATGDNEKIAKEKGINTYGIKLFAFAFSGFMAALGGILSCAKTMTASYVIGEGYEFKAITACVLGGVSLNGGRGTVFPGVVIGALIISLISNLLVLFNADTYIYDIVYGIVIFVVVMIDTFKIIEEKKHLA